MLILSNLVRWWSVKKANKQQVSIIAGKWRRRILSFPVQEGLRPTPNRIRETLFNWLGQDLTGLDCLDLFAGSGALGFEAASRNARSVLLVENNPQAIQALKQNKLTLKADQISIQQMDAFLFLSKGKYLFDVIFIDPPFAQDLWQPVLALLPFFLKKDALVYLECQHLPDLTAWSILKQTKAGQVTSVLLHYVSIEQ